MIPVLAALISRHRRSHCLSNSRAFSNRRPRIELLEERVMLSATPNAANPTPNSLGQRVALELRPYFFAHDFPGISVAIVQHGQVALARGYGVANVSSQPPLNVSASTKFEVGSLSKTFTALAVMDLYQQGKITSLDDPISKYITTTNNFDPNFNLPSGWSNFTIRQFLQMSTGIVDVGTTSPWYDQISSISNDPFAFSPPGSGTLYSNADFDVLGALVEQLSGMSYAQFIEQDVFPAFGMTQSTVLTSTETSVAGQAIGYNSYTNGGWPTATLIQGDVLYSSGAIISTATDMGNYIEGLLNSDLLNFASYQTMWTSTPLPTYYSGTPFNPQEPAYSQRGLGWDKVVWSTTGPAQVGKNGEASGYASQLFLYPNTNGFSGTSAPYSKGNGVFLSFNATPANLNATLPVSQSTVATAVYTATQTGAVTGTVTAMSAGHSAPKSLAGVRLFIDTHGTGTYEPGDPWAQTNSNGFFVVTDVPPGTHELHLVTQPGYSPKQPNASTATVVVAAGEVTFQNWVLGRGNKAAVAPRAIVSGNQLVINLGPGLGRAASIASSYSLGLAGKDGVFGTSAVLHPRVRQATYNPINGTVKLVLARQIKSRGMVRVRLETSGRVQTFEVTLAPGSNA
jgi:CubicO group peptidase (beta-lactamase class C family)